MSGNCAVAWKKMRRMLPKGSGITGPRWSKDCLYVRLRRRLGTWPSPRKGFADRAKHALIRCARAVDVPARLKIAVASEDSITCWRRYRIRVILNTKGSSNGWVKNTIRKSSPARRSIGYCVEEKSERLDLPAEKRVGVVASGHKTGRAKLIHTGSPKGHT